MLGILQYSDHSTRNYISQRVVKVNNISFLEINLEIKRDKNNFVSKRYINRVFKIFKSHNIRKVCMYKCFEEFSKKYGVICANHDLLIRKLCKKILFEQKCSDIYIYARNVNQEVLDFLNLACKLCDSISIDFGAKTFEIQQKIIYDYGISVINLSVCDFSYRTSFFFDKPDKEFIFISDKNVYNLSGKKLNCDSLDSVLCETDLYRGKTDITAICNLIYSENVQKNIKIKKIIINT